MADSNEKSKPKDNKRLVHCKNCRQDIQANKMFLHEGFCQRNNIFCEHCQKVFLKKDYEKHLKSAIKKTMKHLKTPERPKRKEKEAKIKTINIYTSPIITKRKTSFEYIEMPMTEQYKVNNPIIISENGQILSNENNNEYLLPYFGINSADSKKRNKYLGDDIIINKDEFYEESNPIILNENDLNINQSIESSIKNTLNTDNINIEYNIFNGTQNIELNTDKINSKLNIIELTENKDFINNKNSLTRSHSSNMLLNDINLNNTNLKQHYNNINNNYDFIQNNSDSKKINPENNQKNNNIIINNNIITYNSNNNINKIHNFFNSEENKQNIQDKKNTHIKPLMDNNIFKDLTSTKFNPTRVSKKIEIIKFKKNLENNIKNNLSKKDSKEPNDSGSKKKPRNTKIATYMLEPAPQNNLNKNSNNKIPQTEKKIRTIQKCEFCNSEVNDLVTHYKIYHYIHKNNIKPQKRDTVLLNEKLDSSNTDETGIDESNKRILLRQFHPIFQISDNYKKINYITTKNSKNYMTEKKIGLKLSKFKSPERIQKVKKINLNNMEFEEKTEKKNFPEDNIRGSLLAKTQARDYERKRLYIGDNIMQSENRSNKNRISMKPNDILLDDNNYAKNANISPIYLFTEGKKNEYLERKDIIRSPIVQKIDFLKTVFDEDEKY